MAGDDSAKPQSWDRVEAAPVTEGSWRLSDRRVEERPWVLANLAVGSRGGVSLGNYPRSGGELGRVLSPNSDN